MVLLVFIATIVVICILFILALLFRCVRRYSKNNLHKLWFTVFEDFSLIVIRSLLMLLIFFFIVYIILLISICIGKNCFKKVFDFIFNVNIKNLFNVNINNLFNAQGTLIFIIIATLLKDPIDNLKKILHTWEQCYSSKNKEGIFYDLIYKSLKDELETTLIKIKETKKIQFSKK